MPTFIPNPAYTAQTRTISPSLSKGLLYSIVFAVLIALSAQVAFPLPFTDVPVTLQVFAVMLAGGLLGSRWGTLSVVEYVVAGAAGAPVFAQGKSGFWVLMGPTGGYIVGFILAAAVVGALTERTRNKGMAAIALVLGLLLIYLCGALWRHYGLGLPWSAVFTTSILPFIAADALKALAAWVLIVSMPRVLGQR
ncbi:MAG: biotin transporter BioY [Armatimonadetes bacterium]|nr:biotin transporter BioY [Armatimonadota bacterium]